MLDMINNFILKNKLLDKNKAVVVSDSTGVDSSVLLDVLYKLNYKVVIAHVNHNKRIQSYDEMAYLKDYAKKLSIPFECIILDELDGNFHNSARDKRYTFFKEVASKYDTNQIVTAHHSDDNLETILMKITRGSNLYGYAGIKMKIKVDNFIISRPLLCVSKDMIYEYAKTNNITYFEDSSNSEDHYTRNRFRHHIIPLIKEENKNIHKASFQYQNQLLMAFNYIRKKTLEYKELSLSDFNNVEVAIKYDYISLMLENNHIDPSFDKISDIISFLSSNSSNSKLDIGNNKRMIIAYNKFYISDFSKKNMIELIIDKFGEYEFGKYIITFDKNITKNTQKYIRICYNNTVYPLKIRTRRDGDYIKLPFGRKKIKDLFIDKKIPMNLRDSIPLLFDGNNNLIGIPGIIQTKQENFDCYMCFRRKENE